MLAKFRPPRIEPDVALLHPFREGFGGGIGVRYVTDWKRAPPGFDFDEGRV